MVSAVYQVTCGVRTTLSRLSSGLSAGTGSTAKTSRPAAASRPPRSASTSAASSTIGPREVLTSTASGFISASAAASIRPGVAVGQRQVQRDDVALGQQVGQRPPAGVTVVAGAGVQHVGAHRGARSSRPAWRRCRSRPARRCSCRCRAPSRRASDPTASPRPSRVARSSAGSRRSAASISSTVPSATDGALAPGMLATAMPQPRGGVDVDGVHARRPACAPAGSRGARSRSAPDSGRSTCQITSASGSSR